MARPLQESRNPELSLNTPGGRITNQAFYGLCAAFSELLDLSMGVLSTIVGRRFSERQAYGFFVQSLLQSETRQPDFVLTEVPISRNPEQGEESSGSLDYLYSISDQAFAVELKVKHCGLKNDGKEKLRIARAWFNDEEKDSRRDGVINQLKSLDFEADFFKKLESETRRGRLVPRKFPLLIVCYHRDHKADSPLEEVKDDDIVRAHKSVLETLSRDKYVPSFDSLYALENRCQKLKKSEERAITIVGLGFFGGAACFE